MSAESSIKALQGQIAGFLNANVGSTSYLNTGMILPTQIVATMVPNSTQTNFLNTQTQTQVQNQNQNATGTPTLNAIRDMKTQGYGNPYIAGTFTGSAPSLAPISDSAQQTLSGLTQSSDGLAGMDNMMTSEGPSKRELRKMKREANKSGDGSPSGGGFSDFMSSKGGAAVSAAAGDVGGAVNTLGNMLGDYKDRPAAQQLNETQESVRSAIYSGVAQIPMFGPLISAGLQLQDGLGKMLGGQMSNISKDAAEDAGLSRGWNNVLATIPGVGSMLGWFAKKTDEFKIDRDRLSGVGSAYDMSSFNSAEDLSGGKFLGQRNKVNQFIAEQNRLRDIMTGISDAAKLRKEGASAMAADLAQQNKNRYAGLTGAQMAVGKQGMKIPNLDWSRNFLIKYKSGGKTEKPKKRTIEELKEYAESVNPRFVQRMNDPNLSGIDLIDDNGNKAFGTHYLEIFDDNGEHFYVYPRIQEVDGKTHFFEKWEDAWQNASNNKDFLYFDNLEEAENFSDNYKQVYPVFQKFQKGGKLGTPGIDSNVIVEGAYHAHKNHLDEVNPELSDMTPKGIPVAYKEDGGELVQTAEIEQGELILTKELTEKLEALYHDGSEEAMIEAGKIFANEIILNTQDNKGGVLDKE